MSAQVARPSAASEGWGFPFGLSVLLCLSVCLCYCLVGFVLKL